MLSKLAFPDEVNSLVRKRNFFGQELQYASTSLNNFQMSILS
jgi:hypothetical protein